MSWSLKSFFTCDRSDWSDMPHENMIMMKLPKMPSPSSAPRLTKVIKTMKESGEIKVFTSTIG